MPCIREGDVEERSYDVLLSFSNIAALIAGTLLLDWRENLIKRNIFLQCAFCNKSSSVWRFLTCSSIVGNTACMPTVVYQAI